METISIKPLTLAEDERGQKWLFGRASYASEECAFATKSKTLFDLESRNGIMMIPGCPNQYDSELIDSLSTAQVDIILLFQYDRGEWGWSPGMPFIPTRVIQDMRVPGVISAASQTSQLDKVHSVARSGRSICTSDWPHYIISDDEGRTLLDTIPDVQDPRYSIQPLVNNSRSYAMQKTWQGGLTAVSLDVIGFTVASKLSAKFPAIAIPIWLAYICIAVWGIGPLADMVDDLFMNQFGIPLRNLDKESDHLSTALGLKRPDSITRASAGVMR